jgi:hypothetical protein
MRSTVLLRHAFTFVTMACFISSHAQTDPGHTAPEQTGHRDAANRRR